MAGTVVLLFRRHRSGRGASFKRATDYWNQSSVLQLHLLTPRVDGLDMFVTKVRAEDYWGGELFPRNKLHLDVRGVKLHHEAKGS